MNSEQHALDEIDALMAQALDEDGVPLDDYTADRYVKCEHCQGDWHGTPNNVGCPGAWADAKEVAQWRESKSVGPDADSELFASLVQGHGGRAEHGLIGEFPASYPLPDDTVVYGTVQIFGQPSGFLGVFIPNDEQPQEIPAAQSHYDAEWQSSVMTITANPVEPQGFQDLGYISDTP